VDKQGRTLAQRAYHELKEFAVIVLYLWVVLGLFLLYKSVLLNEEHISFLAKGFAIINALVLGKIILIARALHIGDWANRRPLIYPTIIKSALFSIVLALFKILEAAVVGWYRHEPFQQTISEFGGGTTKGILTLTLLMFVVLIPFCGFTELQRVMGEGKLAQVFFGLRESTNQLEFSSKT
jgi:nitrate reductase NapE component